MGIEPTSQAWEARILPMNYTRGCQVIITNCGGKIKGNFLSQAAEVHSNEKSTVHCHAAYGAFPYDSDLTSSTNLVFVSFVRL